jgi:tetratricopeptide (TPR) repeat protein
MTAPAEMLGHVVTSPWSAPLSTDLLPFASEAPIQTEYSFARASMGVGRWSSGFAAELLELKDRNLAARKAAAAERLFANHQYVQALALCRDACRADPGQPHFQFMAGISAWNAGLHNEAGIYLREAVRLQPAQAFYQCTLADWCLDHGDFAAAMHHSARAIELAPGEAQTLVSRASVLEAHGQRKEAWPLVLRLLQSSFRSAKLAGLYTRLASGSGHEQAALNELHRQVHGGALSPADHRMLYLAAATLLDRLGRFDEAFVAAQAAHAHERLSYDPNWIEQVVRQQLDYFTPTRLHDLPRSTHGSRRPVFIIGMPRSGTSLVEQILASHPDVYGAGELTALSEILHNMGGFTDGPGGFPRCFDELSMRAADQHAASYLETIRRLNATSSLVTDKMPTNFLLLGLIAVLFPDAHVIHCTRNPLDTCLSCYLTNFAVGHDLAHDLEHLGGYYRQYRRLMDHWTGTLNFPMLEVTYEEVIADQLGQSRRMLEFLGLPWDARCATFHKSPRQTTTASANQVNQPIYNTSVNRWKNYEKHLAPLGKALAE